MPIHATMRFLLYLPLYRRAAPDVSVLLKTPRAATPAYSGHRKQTLAEAQEAGKAFPALCCCWVAVCLSAHAQLPNFASNTKHLALPALRKYTAVIVCN